MDKPRIFLSVGSTGTTQQKEATETIFSVIEAAGLSPRQMEKNEWSSEQPLRAIRKIIDQCHGAVIIAFTRYEFPAGIEHAKNNAKIDLADARFPTVWNQIEAALAYSRNMPLLVVCEQGLREDGLLEGKYDWKVFSTTFEPHELRSERFLGYVASWKRLVDEHVTVSTKTSASDSPYNVADVLAKASLLDLTKLPLSKLITWLGAFVSVLLSVAATAFKVGGGHWPWQ